MSFIVAVFIVIGFVLVIGSAFVIIENIYEWLKENFELLLGIFLLFVVAPFLLYIFVNFVYPVLNAILIPIGNFFHSVGFFLHGLGTFLHVLSIVVIFSVVGAMFFAFSQYYKKFRGKVDNIRKNYNYNNEQSNNDDEQQEYDGIPKIYDPEVKKAFERFEEWGLNRKTATAKDVKKIRNDLLKKFHADKNQGDTSNDEFIKKLNYYTDVLVKYLESKKS